MEAKHGKKPDKGTSNSKSDAENTHARMETNLPNKRKFSHSVQKKLHCEHYQKNGHTKDHLWKLHPKLVPKSKNGKKFLMSQATKVEEKEIDSALYVDDRVSLMV